MPENRLYQHPLHEMQAPLPVTFGGCLIRPWADLNCPFKIMQGNIEATLPVFTLLVPKSILFPALLVMQMESSSILFARHDFTMRPYCCDVNQQSSSGGAAIFSLTVGGWKSCKPLI